MLGRRGGSSSSFDEPTDARISTAAGEEGGAELLGGEPDADGDHLGRPALQQEQHDAVRDVFLAPGGGVLVRADLFAGLGIDGRAEAGLAGGEPDGNVAFGIGGVSHERGDGEDEGEHDGDRGRTPPPCRA